MFTKKLFIEVWQGSKFPSGASSVSEIMLAIDDFSSDSWFECEWIETLLSAKTSLYIHIPNYSISFVEWYGLMLFIKQYIL